MSEPLERNQVIELLDKLGSEQDENVLAAARMLHSQIIECGMGWEDLLVGDEPEGEEETQDDSLPDEDNEDDRYDQYDQDDDGCVSKVVEIGFGASPSGLSFAAVRPRGQGFRRRLADRGFPIHRLCASGFGRKRGAPRGASALFRDTAARSVF